MLLEEREKYNKGDWNLNTHRYLLLCKETCTDSRTDRKYSACKLHICRYVKFTDIVYSVRFKADEHLSTDGLKRIHDTARYWDLLTLCKTIGGQ